MHTWLPDAHSEAPTPVSALLSGSLLAVSFYAILRFYQFTAAALGSGFPRDALLAFGVASLLLAALYVFGQRDVKRLLAYSSVEHMGILAIGVSFGAPVALAGVMLHVLAHAAAKGNAFMGAGVLVTKFGSKQISAIRGGLDLLPWSGPLFLLAVFALSAMPPSGIFRSEFQIVYGGLGSGNYAAAAVLIVLVTVAFFGLTASATQMLFTPAPCGPADAQPRRALRLDGRPGPGRRRGPVHPRHPSSGGAHWPDRPRRPPAGGGADDDDPARRHRAVGELCSRVKAGRPVRRPVRHQPEGGPLVLSAHLATAGGIDTLEAPLPPGAASYPALTPRLGAAFWYERVIHDRFGVVPDGHPRLAPLIRPGTPEDYALPRHVAGYGVFTIPHGPVRSGVMESIEYLVETPGEAIPHLNMRVFYKHRGIADRFAGMTPADGVLLAERAEGIASVAHALAFCHAVETIAGCQPPPAARPGPGAARRTGADRQPPRRRRPAGRRGRARGGHRPVRAAQGAGAAAGQRAVRQPVRPRRGGARRGRRAAAAAARADTRRGRQAPQGRHRRRRRADGHLLVPGPAARHRAADPGAGPPARRARPDREGVRVRRRRPAGPARTTGTRR